MASDTTPKNDYNIIITGASGFVGQALALALLSDPVVSHLTLVDINEPPIPSKFAAAGTTHVQTQCLAADLTNASTAESLFADPKVNLVYLLHGIMSSQAEADLELGLRVNLDSIRLILDILRKRGDVGGDAEGQGKEPVKVVFTGSAAVYGSVREPGWKVTEWDAAIPGTSYGAQKHIGEVMVDDFSRRGQIDGRVVRLPTVCVPVFCYLHVVSFSGKSGVAVSSNVFRGKITLNEFLLQVTVRPGKPTGAASSFASGIFREPLKGEKSILPVSKETEVWICSPRTVVKNLVLARDIPKDCFGRSRIVNLPGVTVTVNEMLDALKVVGGEEALELVEEKRDKATEAIVASWPPRFDTSRAEMLGFVKDGDLIDTLRQYVEDYGDAKV